MALANKVYLKLRNPLAQLTQQEDQVLKPYLDFMKVVLGKMFIQGYRIFSKAEESLILIRRSNRLAFYCFVLIIDEPISNPIDYFINWSKICLDRIKVFSPDKPEEIGLTILELKTFTTKTLNWHSNPKSQTSPELLSQTFHGSTQPDKELAMQSRVQFQKLKWIINDYIDRVGEFKELLIQEQLKACKFILSFDLRMLLQTVNLVMAEELMTRGGTQIESYEWSQFNPSEKEWKGERRDTIIKNGGRITVIDWIFLQDIEKYLTYRYLTEAKRVIKSYEDSFDQVQLVIYSIMNEVGKNGITYSWKSRRFYKSDIEDEKDKFAYSKKKPHKKAEESGIVEVIELSD